MLRSTYSDSLLLEEFKNPLLKTKAKLLLLVRTFVSPCSRKNVFSYIIFYMSNIFLIFFMCPDKQNKYIWYDFTTIYVLNWMFSVTNIAWNLKLKSLLKLCCLEFWRYQFSPWYVICIFKFNIDSVRAGMARSLRVYVHIV